MEKELIKIIREETKFLKGESKYLIPSYSELYKKVVNKLVKPFKKLNINKVVVIEMAGLLFAPIIAHKLGVGLVPIFKGNRISTREEVLCKSFIDYSGNNKSIEILKTTIKPGEKILLIDDWFETGNTGRAAIGLIEKLGGIVVGIGVVFDKLGDNDRKFFENYNYHYLARLGVKK